MHNMRAGGGCVGVLLTGLFAHGELGEGLVYGNARLLWVQMVGCVAIGAWSCTLSIVFWVMMRWLGLTRMSEEAELLGTDQQLFCEPAYPESYAMGDYLKVRGCRSLGAINALRTLATRSSSNLWRRCGK